MSEDIISRSLKDGISLKKHLLKETETIMRIATVITDAFKRGNKVLIFGNGGSAADAEHIAAELMGQFKVERSPLPALALTGNQSLITAIGNDYGYENVFFRQVQGLIVRGDVAIGISTSGNSENVIKAIEEAKRRGAKTVSFTNQTGRLSQLADIVLAIPSLEPPRIQEAHITAGHIICELVEQAMFGGK